MSGGYLFIHPPAGSPVRPTHELLQALKGAGFMGDPASVEGRDIYPAGERFLQLISFLGCSPAVRLEPAAADDSDYCYLQLLGPFSQPTLLWGSNTRPPGCPHCKRRLEPWRDLVAEGVQALRCGACGRSSDLADCNWRQQAGVSELFLLVAGIFPGEAVPVPELLKTLQGDGESWRYGYLQQPRLLGANGQFIG